MASTYLAVSFFLSFLSSTFKLVVLRLFTTTFGMYPGLVKLVDDGITTYTVNESCKRKLSFFFTVDHPLAIPTSTFNTFLFSAPFQASSLLLTGY